MKEILDNAEILFNEGKTEEALKIINGLLSSDQKNIACLMLRAKFYYKLQKWGEALNDLNNILDEDPLNVVALNYRTMVLDIVKFWNKDNFNP